MSEQHLGIVRITGELLRDHLFRTSEPGKWYRVVHGIPADAEFVRMAVDFSYGNEDLCIVYRHPSFPKSRPGEPIPLLDPPMLASYTMETPPPVACGPPAFNEITLQTKRFAGPGVIVSKEYAEGMDVARMFDAELGDRFGKVLKREMEKLEQQILHGNGGPVPQGIINADDADEPHIAQG